MCSLHERYITVTTADGREESLSALDVSRVENVEFVEFRPLPSDKDQAAVDAWLERANFIIEDLRWLLKLPYERFWCQLIFDNSLHRCIDSYLKEAHRPHDVTGTTLPGCTMPSDVTDCLKSVHRLFFLVCLRSSTLRESPTNFVDGKVFGDILYENYIFDIPRLMDICVVYGHGSDAALVSKMIGNIFQQQPKYTDDLYTVVLSIEKVFDTLCSKCGVPIEAGVNTPPKLTSVWPSLESLPASQFEDIVTYISDVAHTLNSFLKVYPSGSSVFWKRHSFLLHLAMAYECFAVVIPEAFRKCIRDSEQHAAVLKKQFRRSQVCLLRIFRLIVYHVCLRPVADGETDEDEIARGIEGYLDVMNAVLGEKHFIAHLQVLFPFDGDRTIISQSLYLVDEPRLQYIEDAYSSAATEHNRKHQKLDANFAVVRRNSDYSSEQIDFDPPDADIGLSDVAGASLDSMVLVVRDLLPEFGRGFVELCLEEFDCDVEKVINALLENNLPPNLQGVDRSLENAHDTSAGVNDNSSSLLSQRRNVYDGDEFDVFSRSDIDLGRVHWGKRDKNDIDGGGLDADIRARSAAYALQQVTISNDIDDVDGVWEYEDEYDDTYDSNVIGADDADSADEMMSRRPFVVPRIFADRSSDRGSAERNDYEEEKERDVGATELKSPHDAFIEDPAVLRQRREQQWTSRQQRRRSGADRGAEVSNSNSGRTHDVKGLARGQGQSAEVLRNRAWKEKNKASRVHHNRKDLADRKRRV